MLLACGFLIFGKQQNGDSPFVRASLDVKHFEQESGYGGAEYDSVPTQLRGQRRKVLFLCVSEVQIEVLFQSSLHVLQYIFTPSWLTPHLNFLNFTF